MPKPTKFGFVLLNEVNNNGFAAAALNVGDTVWFSADRTVNKSAVAADHQKLAGVVVAGARAGPLVGNNPDWMEPIYDPNLIAAGVAAATGAGDTILIAIAGEVYVITDAAIAVGLRIAPSTTVAGRVRPATDPVIAAGGVAVTSTAANGAIITGDGFGRGLGRMTEASCGAGVAKRAMIFTF
jgi:hypothetical protein